MNPNKMYKVADSKDDLIKKFHKKLKEVELKKINQVINEAFGNAPPGAYLAAIGNPDGPNWKQVPGVPDSWEYVGGVKPDSLILDEAFNYGEPLADLKNAYLKLTTETSPFKAALMAIEHTTWQTATPVKMFGKAFTCYAEIKDDKGKMVMIPLSQPPIVETEYSFNDGPQVKMLNPDIVVESVHQVFEDGEIQVVKGPFKVHGSWKQVTQPVKIVKEPVTLKAKSVTIEHNGVQHILSVGDLFTVNFHVNLDGPHSASGVVFDHNETVKVVAFNYAEDQPQKKFNTMPSPPPSEENKRQIRQHRHNSNGTFSSTWIAKKECFLIGGYYKNKRYDVVLGEPINGVEMLRSLFGDEMVPNELASIIRNCEIALRQHARDKADAFKHPKLHSIKVKCPAYGKTLKEGSFLTLSEQVCTYCQGEPADLYNLIQHLNDSHKWSREKIADWIDTLDEQPVFYPQLNHERVANSASVVVVESPV